MVLLISRFAAAEHFRSATVDELELDGDFCRRPLRPEDLQFINFAVPVVADTICDLPSLAAQRIMRCIYDMQIARLPRSGDRRTLERHAEFYSDASRIVAVRIAPFLERFAFGFLEQSFRADGELSHAKLREDFEIFVRDSNAFARATRTRFLQGDFSKADLRFVLVQKWCLAATKHVAIARAQASGFFDLLSPADWPQYGSDRDEYDVLTRLAIANDVNRDPHAFWQFYLPTSLAETNYLSALAARPEFSLVLVGASFVAESESQSLAWMARQACQDVGIAEPNSERLRDLDRAATGTTMRFARALTAVENAFGTCGLEELSRGVNAAARLAQLARLDLEKQLRWLASLDDYAEIARRLDHRIRTQRPNIDRETFVEPREMCSTTHVHNDHRLVVIESGNMVFWGRPEMRFRMAPGDMILVPRGRLHGSSVESEQCIYHQPIIPEEWVRPLIDEVDQRHGWPTEWPD
jgi:hypothetical protein